MSFMSCPSDRLTPSVLITFSLSMISTPHFFIPNCIPMSILNIWTVCTRKSIWFLLRSTINNKWFNLNPCCPISSYPQLLSTTISVKPYTKQAIMDISYHPEKSVSWYQLLPLFSLAHSWSLVRRSIVHCL